MTATTSVPAAVRRDILTARLESLRQQRVQAREEVAPQSRGDDADRATNVDAHVRLAMLDDRIAALEVDLAMDLIDTPRQHEDGVVDIGNVVTVDFGDGPENYLLGSVEQAGDGVDVITPGSPLGRALLGAKVGSAVEYRASRRVLQAQVVAIAA